MGEDNSKERQCKQKPQPEISGKDQQRHQLGEKVFFLSFSSLSPVLQHDKQGFVLEIKITLWMSDFKGESSRVCKSLDENPEVRYRCRKQRPF